MGAFGRGAAPRSRRPVIWRMVRRADQTRESGMPSHEYVTVNVFTEQRFGGNPLAVLPDARGLSDAQMQAIATEFNLSETAFVLPPDNPQNHAKVRIFTRQAEMP